MDAARVDAAGRPRFGPVHVGDAAISRAGIAYFQDNTDYTFYSQQRVTALYYVELRPRPGPARPRLERRRLRRPHRAGIPAAGRDREDDLDRRPLLRAAWRTATASSRASRTTRTRPRSISGTAYYGVEPGTTDNVVLPFEERPEDGAVSPPSARSAIRRTKTGRFTAGLRWFDHTRTRDYFIQHPNGHFTAPTSARPRSRPATSPRSCRCSTTSPTTRWCTRSTPTASAPAAETSARPALVLPPDYEPDFLDNYELGFKSRWAGRPVRAEPHAFQMEWEDYQVEVVDPGRVVSPCWSRTSATPRSRASASISTRYLWDSLDFGLNLQLLDPRDQVGQRAHRHRARGPAALLAGGEGGGVARIHFPRRVRGRPFLRPLPVDL